jgi:glutathione synthase/RimK-type ligase-like ATP-grasp enzyme
VVVADFFDPSWPLPEHRLIFNGIGDADVAMQALAAAESLLRQTSAPVLNPPSAVRMTGRCENAARLGRLPGVTTAKMESLPYASLAGEAGAELLIAHGFTWPLLLRVPGQHMGKDFVLVETAAALPEHLEGLAGSARRDISLLAMQYLDARGVDGCFRKYRVMMVAGEVYPLHLAISDHWKVHYFSADMKDRPEHRAEEALFLTDMAAVVGPSAMNALRAVEAALGLDYAGVDFGLGPDGDVLLFEANATMVFGQPDDDARWDYRRAAVAQIEKAVAAMLRGRCLTPVPPQYVRGEEQAQRAASRV